MALAAFVCGARLGVFALAAGGSDRLTAIGAVTAATTSLLVVAAVLGIWLPLGGASPARYIVAAVLALAMGTQNAAAKKLAVPDLTTTVLTMTLTALGSGGPGARRRVTAIAAMLAGALVGGLIVLHVSSSAALGLAALVTAGVAATALIGSRANN